MGFSKLPAKEVVNSQRRIEKGVQVFCFESLVQDINEQVIAAAVHANSRQPLEKTQRLRVKELANRHFVASRELEVFREVRVRVKIDVLRAEHLADKAEKRFGIKREKGYHQARRVKRDDRLCVRVPVFSASDSVGIIENRDRAAVVRSLQKRDDVSRAVI